MSLTKELIQRALTLVETPDMGDLMSAGIVEWISACDGYASIKLHMAGGADSATMMQLAGECDQAVRAEARRAEMRVDGLLVKFVDEAGNVVFQTGAQAADEAAKGSGFGSPAGDGTGDRGRPLPQAGPVGGTGSGTESGGGGKPNPQQSADAMPGVEHVIAVGAGKGGVGKSTISVNLAVALGRMGKAVGLLDGDIYGPSMPTMLGLDPIDQVVHEGKLQPFAVHGVKAVTVGKLVDPEKPLIWRGPMAHGAFQQLTSRTHWGELDRLVIDLPPGTGDIPLTMAQSLRLSGAVIVCTPQRVAQDDAVRATRMFQQLGVEILGVVENMSYFIGDDGKEYDLFGRGGAEMMAQRMGLAYLGAVPINTSLRKNGDSGEPLKNFEPDSAGGDALVRALEGLATNLESQLALAAMRTGSKRPTLTIS